MHASLIDRRQRGYHHPNNDNDNDTTNADLLYICQNLKRTYATSRSGEIKFNRWSNWVFDPFYKVLDIGWMEPQNFKVLDIGWMEPKNLNWHQADNSRHTRAEQEGCEGDGLFVSP